MSRPRAGFGSLLALVLLTFTGCAGEEEAAPSGGTTDVGANLLASQKADQPGMSRAEGPPPSIGTTPQRRQQYDIAELGYNEGDGDAKVRIIEFSDFGCGYCRSFHMETYPTLHDEYLATGKVEWKYVPVILGIFGPNAQTAALAGECAGSQGRFAEMRDALFARQSDWKRADDPMPALQDVARGVGLDMEAWQRCVDGQVPLDRVRAGTQLAFQVGMRGTPTFIVVGYAPIPGAIPLELFREVLDTVLEDQAAAEEAGS